MTRQSIAVELDEETIRSLSVYGPPATVLGQLAHLAAGSDRLTPAPSIEAIFDSAPPLSLRLADDERLIAEQREANEEMVRSTLRAQDRAVAADEGMERAEVRERALHAVAELREMFIGILGHDLRNPLNSVITGAAMLLRRGRLDGHDAETTVRIIRSGQRITRMITQLLDLTRARLGGGLPIEPQPSHMGDICRYVIDEFEQPVALETSGDLNGSWDADRLSEVISNLAGNGLEYARPGTAVAVKTYEAGTSVVVEVSNQGDPIPADVLPFIFQPFRRAQQREKSMAGNLGLGLYIAHQIVLSHGGTIEASCHDGTTTFVVRLPRFAPAPAPAPSHGGARGAAPLPIEIDTFSRQAALDSEARYREGDQRYRRLFDSIGEGFCVLERVEGAPGDRIDFRFLEANPAFSVHAGLTGVVGKSLRETVLGEAEEWVATYDAICRTGEPTRFERVLAATGRVLAVRAFRVEDATPCRVAVVFQDITSRKLLEREASQRVAHMAELERRKCEFLGTLGHELRNPLSTLVHAIALLEKPAADGPGSDELLRTMGRQTARMGVLLDQILNVARATSGRMELTRIRTDLAEVARDAVSTVRHLVDSHRQTLTVSLPAGSLWVLGDSLRLAQAIENLLTNAAKCTPEGGRIDLTLDAIGDEARIIVRDDGQGMSAELLPHIFELFIQEPQTLDRPRGGLGLGLPLVERLVRMHDGHVTASSPGLGRGSELVVKLPMLRAGPSAAPVDVVPVVSSGAAVASRRILVVDDEVEMAEMLGYLLEGAGHRAHVAHDGWSTLDAVREVDPQVIILDLGLPGMDGYEVARKLRDEHGDSRFLLIAVTGYQNDGARLRAAGFDEHLTKPPDMKKLFAYIAGWKGRP